MLPVMVGDVDGHPHSFGQILLVRPLSSACRHHVAFELYHIIDTAKLIFSSIRGYFRLLGHVARAIMPDVTSRTDKH